MTQKILILTGDFVDDYELMVPYSILTMFGCEVKIICPGREKGEFIKTAIHYISIEDWELALKGKSVTYSESLGHPYRIDDDFDWKNVEKEVTDYDGLIIPGGRAPEYLSLLPDVHKLVFHFIKNYKPIGAICHGPQILAHTDAAFKDFNYLKDKKMYPYPSVALACSLQGAIIEDQYPADSTYTADNLVTAPSWLGLPEFMKQFLKLLGLVDLP
ncbi:MAG: DJ-1/PfpI family protein [Candidatus Lokiarchaeota archaeon]|nr:DJ-1/PfpI family protein [Candidatus Lokiarchaeota archaeon]